MPRMKSAAADPLACALSPNDLDDRLAGWQSLNDQALVDVAQEAGRLTTRYRADEGVARRLAELIEAEKECCPFLHFEMTHHDEIVSMVLSYPSEVAGLIPLSAPTRRPPN
jgi:hypothetical protein